jgi:hypothetical protein
VDQLNRVVLPAKEGEKGAQVRVVQSQADGQTTTRLGWVTGISGRLDTQTRTATLMVTVPEPYAGEGAPLLPGAFVSVVVEGVSVDSVYAVPHQAVHTNRFIWVDEDGALALREVVIGWRTESESYVLSGLTPGDRVITTNMPLPIKGMKVSSNE